MRYSCDDCRSIELFPSSCSVEGFPLHYATTVHYSNTIYAVGGLSIGRLPQKDIFVFDNEAMLWYKMDSPTELSRARSSVAAVLVDWRAFPMTCPTN